jgi:hypothetical protein
MEGAPGALGVAVGGVMLPDGACTPGPAKGSDGAVWLRSAPDSSDWAWFVGTSNSAPPFNSCKARLSVAGFSDTGDDTGAPGPTGEGGSGGAKSAGFSGNVGGRTCAIIVIRIAAPTAAIP